jgi:hypothetical protein
MRTAIYVQATSHVTIHAEDPRDAEAPLRCYLGPTIAPAVGTHKLAPGIYLVVTRGPLAIEGDHLDVETLRNDKDEWPDPKPNVIALAPMASAASIKEFFFVAKDLSVDG